MNQFVMSKFASPADLYAAMSKRITELEADNKAAWATNCAIDKARMEDRARAKGVAEEGLEILSRLEKAGYTTLDGIETLLESIP